MDASEMARRRWENVLAEERSRLTRSAALRAGLMPANTNLGLGLARRSRLYVARSFAIENAKSKPTTGESFGKKLPQGPPVSLRNGQDRQP